PATGTTLISTLLRSRSWPSAVAAASSVRATIHRCSLMRPPGLLLRAPAARDLTRWQRKRKPAQTAAAALERNAPGGTGVKLQGRVVLVTGGGGGLGRAMAEAFASEGAAVAVTDIDRTAAESVAQGIRTRGGKAMALLMDVAREEQVDGGVAEAVETLRPPGGAGSETRIQPIAPLTELRLEDWRRVTSIPLDGGFLLTRAAMRHWASPAGKGGGLLLYMGSVHSLEASPLKAPYVAAKHGLLGLARAAAKEGAG